jgi:hypothetical protein
MFSFNLIDSDVYCYVTLLLSTIYYILQYIRPLAKSGAHRSTQWIAPIAFS